MIRKLLIAAGALLVLLVVAVVAVVTLVDVNRFKPQIVDFVQDRYQRTLRIEGDLGLSLFPRIALSLPSSSLSERGGKGVAASIAGARVGVAVLPLLRGEIVADKVTIDALKATVERRADGSLSIDDLIKQGQPTSSPPAAPAQAPGRLPRFEIGGVALSGAQITYNDQPAGNTMTVSGLDLTTGRIANQVVTPVSLNFGFTASQPKTSGQMSLKGDAVIDVAAGTYGAKGLDATLKVTTGTTQVESARLKLAGLGFDPSKSAIEVVGLELAANGKLAADGFQASVTAPRLVVTEASASGEALQAVVKLSGSQSIEARIDASGIGGTTKALTVSRLAIDAMTRQGDRTVQAKLATPVKADVPAGIVALPALAGTVVIEDPSLPEKKVAVELTGAASADTQKETVTVDLNARSQGMTLLAKAGVNGFSRPRIGFDVSADRLDIDRYFPQAPAAKPSGGGSTKPGGGQEPDTPIDLSALADLDLDGKLSVGQFQARGIKAADLKATMKAAKGRLTVEPLTASLYGGRLAATAAVKAGDKPAGNEIDTSVDLTGVSIGPLLADAADQDLLEGRGNVKLVLEADGASVNALKRSLDGSAALSLRDGAIKGINLGETIRSARNLLQGGQAESRASDASKKTDFTSMTVSFAISDGVARSDDLDVRSPLLRAGGDGQVDIAASRLDYTVRVSVVGTSAGQGGRELADLRGVTIPVRLVGPFDKLDWRIDWESAGKEALKSRATAELKERLKTDELQEKAKEKAREKLGDTLKGLFQR